MRLSSEDLNKVKQRYNVNRLYSWSKVNTFMTSPYEYFLKNVLHTPEDITNCVYTTMGSIAHDILEKLYNKEIEYSEMDERFEDGWLTSIIIADLKFDRNDEVHNSKLAESYYANLKHFFSNHNVVPTKVATEKFIATKINDYVLQGYIDAVYKDEDGCFNVLDFKTSSIYKGKTLEEHSGQLTVYALGLIQNGVPIEKVKIAFNFLKYVTIEYQQKNGAIKTRDVERCKIGESLQSNAKTWLKANGCSPDEIDSYLMQMLDTNGIECLPTEIQEKYKITDCYVYIPLTEDLIKHWEDTITCAIKDILAREKDYKETDNDKVFYDTEESVKKQSYYFSTLCGYSANLHKPWKDYLDKRESAMAQNIFENVGKDITSGSSIDDSLDWLNDI